MFRNLRMVSNVVYGKGCFFYLDEIINKKRKNINSTVVFIVDDVFKGSSLEARLPICNFDYLVWVDVSDEPSTVYVDYLTLCVKKHMSNMSFLHPSVVVGIGGGSTMDLAKAVSLMLTNPGSSSEYQGWDLINNPGVYHIGVPTLSGTGAEVSRTSVLIGPEKKMGLNSDYTVFDQIILDPDMTEGVSNLQRFYTGMDCFIHCVEVLSGTELNLFSCEYAEKAVNLCKDVFLKNDFKSSEKLMMASYLGGMSMLNSQVGICHALSYGLSFVTGLHHGISNCVLFKILEDFYGQNVFVFNDMLRKQNIDLPKNIISKLDDSEIDKMIDVSLFMEPLWSNALGKNWKTKVDREKIRNFYLKV